MIVGLTGQICSGKETLAEYLVQAYGFQAINILELFRQRIAQSYQDSNRQDAQEEHAEPELKMRKQPSPLKYFDELIPGVQSEVVDKQDLGGPGQAANVEQQEMDGALQA